MIVRMVDLERGGMDGVDFRTAAKVFLDPYVVEFDDLGTAGEMRFNAIGLVDGRMLFVTYTMRGDSVRIISARGAEPHEKKEVSRDLSSIRSKPPKTDWRAFDAMSDEERHRAAASDPDAAPATEAQLARARRVPTVRALRPRLNSTQEEFAARFHLPLGTVRDWEQGAHRSGSGLHPMAQGGSRYPGALQQSATCHLCARKARGKLLCLTRSVRYRENSREQGNILRLPLFCRRGLFFRQLIASGSGRDRTILSPPNLDRRYFSGLSEAASMARILINFSLRIEGGKRRGRFRP
jgi:uncharacterized DUF497 family protein/DNA-binding transcriptional regulator YiaG